MLRVEIARAIAEKLKVTLDAGHGIQIKEIRLVVRKLEVEGPGATCTPITPPAAAAGASSADGGASGDGLTILTVRNTTLPAQVLASLNISPLYFRFAGGFFMIIPSLFFIFFMRKYLFNLWGPGR